MHYRTGTDCGACGRTCRCYRTPGAALAWMAATTVTLLVLVAGTTALTLTILSNPWWLFALPLDVSLLVGLLICRRSLAEQIDTYWSWRDLQRQTKEDAELLAVADEVFAAAPPDPRWDSALEELLAGGPRT